MLRRGDPARCGEPRCGRSDLWRRLASWDVVAHAGMRMPPACQSGISRLVRLDHQRRLRERLSRHRAPDARGEPVPADPLGDDHAACRLRRGHGAAQPGPGGARRHARLGARRAALVLRRQVARRGADVRIRRPPRPLADPRRQGPRQGDPLVRAARPRGGAPRPPGADRAHPDLAAGGHGADAARAVPRLFQHRLAALDRGAHRRRLPARIQLPAGQRLSRPRRQDHHRPDRPHLCLPPDRRRAARRPRARLGEQSPPRRPRRLPRFPRSARALARQGAGPADRRLCGEPDRPDPRLHPGAGPPRRRHSGAARHLALPPPDPERSARGAPPPGQGERRAADRLAGRRRLHRDLGDRARLRPALDDGAAGG